MTDRPRPYHRAEAERLLDYADEWAAQAGEPTPEVGELSCLAYAAVHALLAIHDTLADLKPEPVTVTHPWSNPLTVTHPWPPWPSTLPDVDAADRYAANEAKQREGLLEDAWQFRDWESVRRLQDEAEQREEAVIDYEDIREGMTIEATYSNGTRLRFVATQGYDSWTDPSGCFRITPPGTEGLDPERVIRLIAPPAQTGLDAPEPDPLDEDDHRDRLDRDGDRLTRHGVRHWHYESVMCGDWCRTEDRSLAKVSGLHGPLAFAPDADGAPSVTAPAADDPAGDAVDGEEGERRYLNAQTGPRGAAEPNAKRARLTAQLRQVISSVQDSGDLAELDALADEWEAGTDG